VRQRTVGQRSRLYVWHRTEKANAAAQSPGMALQITSMRASVPSAGRMHLPGSSSRTKTVSRLYDRALEARHVPRSLPLLGTTGEPTRILIVDDVNSTGPLEYLLHGLGYWTTRVASCGETALTTAQDFLPSVVLLALDLPGMSAYRVAERLRERSEGRQLRLIALTADYVHAGRDLARKAGFERFLAKPVSGSALHQLLQANLT
jgi:CheY-like chemotaxis protein